MPDSMKNVLLAVLAVGVLAGSVYAIHANRAPAPTSTVAQPSYSPSPEPTTAVFLGDSYTKGTGADRLTQGYAYLALDRLGWAGQALGVDFTGYANRGPSDNQSFLDRLGQALALKPDVLVVVGSRNDDEFPGAQVQQNATALFTQAHKALPQTRIVAIGPIWPTTAPPPGVLRARDAVKAAAAATGVRFVDPIADGWLLGPTLLAADKIHPNTAGHAYLAGRVVAALSAS